MRSSPTIPPAPQVRFVSFSLWDFRIPSGSHSWDTAPDRYCLYCWWIFNYPMHVVGRRVRSVCLNTLRRCGILMHSLRLPRWLLSLYVQVYAPMWNSRIQGATWVSPMLTIVCALYSNIPDLRVTRFPQESVIGKCPRDYAVERTPCRWKCSMYLFCSTLMLIASFIFGNNFESCAGVPVPPRRCFPLASRGRQGVCNGF